MKYKLVIENAESLAELKQRIARGGKFIVFSYCMSLVAITLRRMSPAIFIEHDDQFRKHKKHYNTISLLLGWWGIPWGLVHTPNMVRANNRGGLDVTEDILLNITEDAFREREVDIVVTSMLFDFPDQHDEQIFRKHFTRLLADNHDLNRLAVGMYLNTEDGVMPYYLIGIAAADYYENYIEDIKKSLYTDFYKHVYFRFMEISEGGEVTDYLLKQGLVIGK